MLRLPVGTHSLPMRDKSSGGLSGGTDGPSSTRIRGKSQTKKGGPWEGGPNHNAPIAFCFKTYEAEVDSLQENLRQE